MATMGRDDWREIQCQRNMCTQSRIPVSDPIAPETSVNNDLSSHPLAMQNTLLQQTLPSQGEVISELQKLNPDTRDDWIQKGADFLRQGRALEVQGWGMQIPAMFINSPDGKVKLSINSPVLLAQGAAIQEDTRHQRRLHQAEEKRIEQETEIGNIQHIVRLKSAQANQMTEEIFTQYAGFRNHFEEGKKAAEGTTEGWVNFFEGKSEKFKSNYLFLRTTKEPTKKAFLELPMWELYSRQENFDTAEMYRVMTPVLETFWEKLRDIGLLFGASAQNSRYATMLESLKEKEYPLYGEGNEAKILKEIITKIQKEQGSIPMSILEMALLKKPSTAIAIAKDFKGSVAAMTFEQFILDLHHQECPGNDDKISSQKRQMANKDKAGKFILHHVWSE